MKYKIAALSDIGTTRPTNQDAFLIEEANTSQGKILLAVICDGMGGFQEGELASAQIVRAFQDWFHNVLPKMTVGPLDINKIRTTWDNIIYRENQNMSIYAKKRHIQMGTTLVAILVTEQFQLIVNIGDSRLYVLENGIYQVTKDHTFVQRELEQKNISKDEVNNHPKKNCLLQCIGASKNIVPDYYSMKTRSGINILLCSDGFRHMVSESELFQYLNPRENALDLLMKSNLQKITDIVKERGEKDNITSILVNISE